MIMRLSDMIKPGGRGVIATANERGEVNTAIYSFPRILNDETVAWGMTEGRTHRNIVVNPFASYLYMNPGGVYSGVRLSLKLQEVAESGDMLEEIKARTSEIVSTAAGAAVKYVAYFRILERRPLI